MTVTVQDEAEPGDAWFGAQLRRRRLAAGKSLRALSAEVHYSKGYLSRIETGAKQPHPDLARLVDAALGAGGALAGLVRPAVRPPEEPSALPMGLLLPGGHPVVETMGGLRDDAQSVASYEALFGRLRDTARAVPAQTVVEFLRLITTTLVQASLASRGRQQQDLLRVAARYAEFLGWMLQEQGTPAEAIAWTDYAVYLGETADDPTMAVHGLIRRALFALYRGDAQETIGLAARAGAMPAASPRLVRFAGQREAQGHALAGDEVATMRALEAAAAIEVDDAASPLGLGPATGAGSLETTLAWCLVELGEAHRAAEIFDRQVMLIPAQNRRSRARFGVRRALAHALDGEVEQACAAAHEVLPDVRAVRSATVNVDVERLSRTIARWPDVEGLTAQLHAVLTPATAHPA